VYSLYRDIKQSKQQKEFFPLIDRTEQEGYQIEQMGTNGDKMGEKRDNQEQIKKHICFDVL